MKKITLLTVIIILFLWTVLVLVYRSYHLYPSAPEQQITEEVASATILANFSCPDGKNIAAAFHNGTSSSVDLSLSDGRTLSLSQTISGSGARYANSDESVIFWNKGNSAFVEESGQMTYGDCSTPGKPAQTSNTGLANPASTNCAEKGGQIIIQTKKDGGQYGLCFFDDNRACEEWAMFRGDCPVGGVKTTGYDTAAQKFCAWSGGKTLTVENANCTFPDGSACLAEDFYSGTCQRGTKAQ